MSKQDAVIYRKAAAIADKNMEASCVAIEKANGTWSVSGWSRLTYNYNNLFKPRNSGVVWGNLWADWSNDATLNTRRQCRVLALCFMAAIAEDE